MVWARDEFSRDVRWLYNYVTPVSDRVDQGALLKLYPGVYRIYTYRQPATEAIVAMMIVAVLKRSNTTHIEVIAVHPNFRGLGLAVPLHKAFLKQLEHDKLPHESISIEAYLHNVDFFRYKLGLHNTNCAVKHPAHEAPVAFMCSTPSKAPEITEEWTEFTNRWPHEPTPLPSKL